MIIELITPLMLATAPMIVPTEPLKYSHETQQVQSQGYLIAQKLSTPGSTQTFDGTGRPRDSDSD